MSTTRLNSYDYDNNTMMMILHDDDNDCSPFSSLFLWFVKQNSL